MKKFFYSIILLIFATFCLPSALAQIPNNTTLFGKIQILIFKNSISIFINEHDDKTQTSNNFVDRIIVLQSETDYSADYFEIDEICEISIFPGIISISYSIETLFLGLKDNLKIIMEQLPLNKGTYYLGYGLSNINAEEFSIERNDITNQFEESIYDFFDNPTPKGKFWTWLKNGFKGALNKCNDCPSGGAGASSCTYGSTWGNNCCSVTCNAGYHACCRECNDCKCCKESTPPQKSGNNAIIYPNPTTSVVNIDFQLINNEEVLYLMVQEFNTGHIVYRKERIIDNIITIETATLKKGYYLITYSIEGYIMSSLLHVQ